MANNIDHHFIPHDQPEVRGGAGGGGGGLPMPIGTNTGDMLVWNAATGVWEVLAKPAGLAVLVAGADGVPVWVAATAKGVLIGNGTTLAWLPTPDTYAFLDNGGEGYTPRWCET